MGPKTVGPWRAVNLSEAKIDPCGPQMTTFLFKNLLLSSPLRMRRAGGTSPSLWDCLNQGRLRKGGRNQSEAFLLCATNQFSS